MPSTVSQLMLRSLENVLGERDDARRAASAEQAYAADISFTDPEGVVRGADGGRGQGPRPARGRAGLRLPGRGPVREAGDLGVLPWYFGPRDQTPVVSGTDIALIRDGRISALCTLLDR